MLTNKRTKDQEMAKRLAKSSPSPLTHRHNPQTWPYHNNLGTRHVRPTAEKKELASPAMTSTLHYGKKGK